MVLRGSTNNFKLLANSAMCLFAVVTFASQPIVFGIENIHVQKNTLTTFVINHEQFPLTDNLYMPEVKLTKALSNISNTKGSPASIIFITKGTTVSGFKNLNTIVLNSSFIEEKIKSVISVEHEEFPKILVKKSHSSQEQPLKLVNGIKTYPCLPHLPIPYPLENVKKTVLSNSFIKSNYLPKQTNSSKICYSKFILSIAQELEISNFNKATARINLQNDTLIPFLFGYSGLAPPNIQLS
ncbi:hypothetical protein [Psychroflexus salis]|nr:hypothetical protein [Psychroflexus salis]